MDDSLPQEALANYKASKALTQRNNAHNATPGPDLIWEINLLLATVTYLVLCPYPHNRLVVNVRGVLMEIFKHWDHDRDLAGYVELHGTPLGIRVRAILQPNDFPNQLSGGYIPGQRVQLQGYLDAGKTTDELIFIEKMAVEVSLPREDSSTAVRLSQMEGVAVEYVYTNLEQLRYSSQTVAAIYMAERALFSSNKKNIQKINQFLTTQHHGTKCNRGINKLRSESVCTTL
ncbi:hypothetical protein PtA15_14A393 [Puccinia triticina]|uniref:Uncharacterized protein n=1 Tax=Puccinia triticina TaxID=208348 RepID=A0ABY7D3X1_9BASI|nr:uncharacterized protein PtA15_14A393 [Puccinia triticina]WAQ91509.1 hypothetical protein PtA15_14A393 [Puccinia triticina]